MFNFAPPIKKKSGATKSNKELTLFSQCLDLQGKKSLPFFNFQLIGEIDMLPREGVILYI